MPTPAEQRQIQRDFFLHGKRHSVAERHAALSRLEKQIEQNKESLLAALFEDLHKPHCEALFSEYLPVLEAVRYQKKHLASFAAGRRVRDVAATWPSWNRVVPEPYGAVLIVSTWNYPLALSLEPLIGAVAAGNNVVIKLSDEAPTTAHALQELISQTFPEDWVCVDGGSDFRKLVQERFDLIFYTGGNPGGREILRGAAEHFTPVILEMGGKNPCVVDDDADLAVTAKRIVWGKFLNAGQTCLAPDYLLVSDRVKPQLLVEMRKMIRRFYGENPKISADYARIINRSHYERLLNLMSTGRLAAGGEHDPEALYIAPTILDDIALDAAIMQEEVFGPILPVLSISTIDDAIGIINSREKPLAIYHFSKSRRKCEELAERTASGAYVANDTIVHHANANLPFGGVGYSGMGAYHGAYTFQAFSHAKAQMKRCFLGDFALRYPPYYALKEKIIDLFR
ncbi:MAG: aldehyde dehydrogenase family protein [Victivallaceae bacterium]|nr:aldehyde dehydrogenase family protein [Victivallaceae bacterium]